MKLSRDSWLGLGLITLLVVLMVAAALQQSSADAIPYLSSSSTPTGTLALKLWLGGLKYKVLELQLEKFVPPVDVDLVLIISPLTNLTDIDLEALDAWVKNGGTLVLAGDTDAARTGFEHFKFSRGLLPVTTPPLAAHTPLLDSPPQVDPAKLNTDYYLSSERTDFVTHIAMNGRPIVVSFDEGNGRVILSTAAYPFSNLGIKEQGNAELALNLVSLSVHRGSVWFDDWHHGLQANTIVGPDQWLRQTSFGHALIFVGLAIFIALVMQGRGFGRPIPLLHEIRRRGPLEHVTAVANLNRKAGHRSAVLAQYHMRLKRHLGKRYRLDPSLPDAEYVRIVGNYNSAVDQKELLGLLTRLSQKNVSEGELVKLADEASKWMTDR